MNTFNKKEFNNGLILLADIVAEVNSYNSHIDIPKDQALKEGLAAFYDYIITKAGIDFTNVTEYIATRLGMRLAYDNLYIIPLWLLPMLPDGLEVETMNGQKIKYDSNSSNKNEKYGIRIVA